MVNEHDSMAVVWFEEKEVCFPHSELEEGVTGTQEGRGPHGLRTEWLLPGCYLLPGPVASGNDKTFVIGSFV